MGRKERLASIRKKIGGDEYAKYSAKIEEAKKKGWKFKEGADTLLSAKDYAGMATVFGPLANEFGMPVSQVVFEEQLATGTDSIYQAIMLWNSWPDLVMEEPEMTYEKFRAAESYYFKRLRDQYPDDETYDLAMSY